MCASSTCAGVKVLSLVNSGYRSLRRLLRAWENETVKLIEAETDDA